MQQVQMNLDLAFGALSDGTRREILKRLTQGSATVSDLAKPFDMSLVAVSKHVKVLENAGLVQRQVRGREHILTLNPTPIREAEEWLGYWRKFWENRLDALAEVLENDNDQT